MVVLKHFFAPDFNQMTYFQNNKSFFAGVISTYSLTESTAVVAAQMYPDDVIREVMWEEKESWGESDFFGIAARDR